MTTTPLLIALAAALGALAVAVYLAHLFRDAPLRDRRQRLVSSTVDEREAA